MTDVKPKTGRDAIESNPKAVSVRIEPKPMSRAKFQRRHDFRIGAQPAYVDEERTHLNRHLIPLRPLPQRAPRYGQDSLNRHLIPLRPLPDIQRENEALRMRASRTRKIKSNAAVVTAGIITFGHTAQGVFNALPEEIQDRAFTELANEIAAFLKTSLEALVMHLDETSIHAHFTLRAYNDDGEPISNATSLEHVALNRYQTIMQTGYSWQTLARMGDSKSVSH